MGAKSIKEQTLHNIGIIEDLGLEIGWYGRSY